MDLIAIGVNGIRRLYERESDYHKKETRPTACCGKSPDAVLTPIAVDINTIRHIRGRESVFTDGCKLYHIRSKFGS